MMSPFLLRWWYLPFPPNTADSKSLNNYYMAVAYTICYLGPGDDADLAVFTTSNTFFHDDSILFTVLVHFLYFRSFLDVPTAFLRCVSGRYFSTSSFVLCTDPAFGPSSVALVNLYGLVKYIALFYPLSHFAFLTLRSSNPSLSSSFALLYCFVTSFISDLGVFISYWRRLIFCGTLSAFSRFCVTHSKSFHQRTSYHLLVAIVSFISCCLLKGLSIFSSGFDSIALPQCLSE